MKKTIFFLIVIFNTFFTKAQVGNLIYYDYMETWDWAGGWWTGTNSNWYNNISVSSPTSAVIIGSGNNTIEADWYVLPNVQLDPNKAHLFKFRLASQSISSPLASTAGNDTGDYVDVQVSTDGGITYTSEIRVRGYGNATWDYNSNGVIYEFLNGTNDIYTPVAGGDRTNTGDGYSEIILELPLGLTDFAVDLYCRVNRAGEEWWIDNIELFEIENIALPVELVSFTVKEENRTNLLSWTTASEYNSDYFKLEWSKNGVDWLTVKEIPAAGNSNIMIHYSFEHKDFTNGYNYYRLTQYDFNGDHKIYDIISIKNSSTIKQADAYFNLMGQEISLDGHRGLYIIRYTDGTSGKGYKP